MTKYHIASQPAEAAGIKAQSAEEKRMSKAISLGALAGALMLVGCMGFSGLANADGATNDTLACYAWSAFPKERINLNIRGGGPLSAATEAVTQRTRGIHGKHVGSCGQRHQRGPGRGADRDRHGRWTPGSLLRAEQGSGAVRRRRSLPFREYRVFLRGTDPYSDGMDLPEPQ